MFLLILASSLLTAQVPGATLLPTRVEYPVQKVFLPSGFDDNDHAEIFVYGEFPNECWTLAEVKYDLKLAEDMNHEIFIQVFASRYEGFCAEVINPFKEVVKLDILRQGNYTVTGPEDEVYGSFVVKQATSESRDEHPYAPVDSAKITYTHNASGEIVKRHVTVLGTFLNSCQRFEKGKREIPRVRQTQENLIEVLPIVELQKKADCHETSVDFEYDFAIPKDVPMGRYLLHIRRQDGRSFNKIVNTLLPLHDE